MAAEAHDFDPAGLRLSAGEWRRRSTCRSSRRCWQRARREALPPLSSAIRNYFERVRARSGEAAHVGTAGRDAAGQAHALCWL